MKLRRKKKTHFTAERTQVLLWRSIALVPEVIFLVSDWLSWSLNTLSPSSLRFSIYIANPLIFISYYQCLARLLMQLTKNARLRRENRLRTIRIWHLLLAIFGTSRPCGFESWPWYKVWRNKQQSLTEPRIIPADTTSFTLRCRKLYAKSPYSSPSLPQLTDKPSFHHVVTAILERGNLHISSLISPLPLYFPPFSLPLLASVSIAPWSDRRWKRRK